MVHPQPGDQLEQVEHLLPLPEAEDHRGGGAEFHAAGRQPHQVGRDPLQLHHQHPDHRGPFGDLLGDAQQPLHRQAVRGLVVQRRQVVGPGQEGDRLRPGPVLAALLDPGVQVADDQSGLGDRLALDLQHEPQHPMGGRMLRPHVDDDALGLLLAVPEHILPVATGDRVDPPAPGLRITSLIGLGRRAAGRHRAPRITSSSGARPVGGSWRPCSRPGCRPAGSPCAADARSSRRAS